MSSSIVARAAVSVAAVAFWAGWEWRDRSADAEIATLRAEHAGAVAAGAAAATKLHGEYRAREQELQLQVNEVSDELSQQLQDAEAEYAAALELARTDLGRLRIENARYRAAGMPSTPYVTLAPSGNDGAAPERVVSIPDTTVDILRIGRAADRVVAQLRACQAYVTQVTTTR